MGELLVSIVKEVLAVVDAMLHFVWENLPGGFFSSGTDRATFVVYNPDKCQFVSFPGAALGADGEVLLQLPSKFAGDGCMLMGILFEFCNDLFERG